MGIENKLIKSKLIGKLDCSFWEGRNKNLNIIYFI